jgi:hypothetical protein
VAECCERLCGAFEKGSGKMKEKMSA